MMIAAWVRWVLNVAAAVIVLVVAWGGLLWVLHGIVWLWRRLSGKHAEEEAEARRRRTYALWERHPR